MTRLSFRDDEMQLVRDHTIHQLDAGAGETIANDEIIGDDARLMIGNRL